MPRCCWCLKEISGAGKASLKESTDSIRSHNTECSVSPDMRKRINFYRAAFPTRWRSMIKKAWEDSDADQVLQHLRNVIGPSGLANMKPPKE